MTDGLQLEPQANLNRRCRGAVAYYRVERGGLHPSDSPASRGQPKYGCDALKHISQERKKTRCHFARKKRSNYWRKNVTKFSAKVTPHLFSIVTEYAPKYPPKRRLLSVRNRDFVDFQIFLIAYFFEKYENIRYKLSLRVGAVLTFWV